ncbi:MAG: hypothetical protein O2816_11550 [Planctomycetota bacterium]|nr:hypothetical protein [Planctomycetota bacterium]
MRSLLTTLRRHGVRAALALTCLAAAPAALADDPIREWDLDEGYYGGSAVDSQGNTVSGSDTWTRKLARDGTELWTRDFEVPGNGHTHMHWTAVDSDDNVIRGGYVEQDSWYFLAVKYDPDGNLLWSSLAPYGYGPEAIRVETDELGGIYVFGETRPTLDPYHAFLTVKFSPTGDVEWSRVFDSGNQPEAMVVRGGRVVCAGQGYNHYATVVYDYDGNELWSALYHGSAGALDVAVGPTGQVAVCGWSRDPATDIYAGTVVHYDGLGNETWVKYHNSPVGMDIFRKVAIDEQGSVIATGVGLTAAADDAWSTIKLDADGNLLWARLLDQVGWNTSSGYEYATSLLIAPSGSIYVGGSSVRPCTGTGLEGHVVKFTPGGDLEWDHPLGDPSLCLSSYPRRLVRDPATGAIVALTLGHLYRFREPVGTSYCSPAIPNSTGLPATIVGTGSSLADLGELALSAAALPPNQFGYFLASDTQGHVVGPGGSQGDLCLGGAIARYAGQVQSSGADGTFSMGVELSSIPTNPPHAIQAGETWNFQCWYRDANPVATSNFTDALAITYQ